jgi:GNAT superfamily N-acetyltransferase
MNLLLAAEVSLLLPQAREFFNEGQIAGKLNEQHFVTALSDGISSGRMFVLASGCPFRGAISGAMYQDLATGETCCMEYFWYVDRHERGSLGLRLIAEFEREAKKRGAIRVTMMHHVSAETDKFTHLYERRGYGLREQVFVKVIT